MPADLLLHNAKVYTVDEHFSVTDAVAISNGVIAGVGDFETLQARFPDFELWDIGGKAIYPGFIDTHCHFKRYALSLEELDLSTCRSFDEVVVLINEYVKTHKPNVVIGRNWDQNNWPGKEFPNNEKLNEHFPNIPILLSRVDLHAALVNKCALDLAEVNEATQIEGGVVETIGGKLSGILIDNAIALVESQLPKKSDPEIEKALQQAEKNCFEVGLTSVMDALMDYEYAQMVQRMQNRGELALKIYGVLEPSEANKNWLFEEGKIKTDRLHLHSFKYFADGALGSRGALMKEDYTDDPGNKGIQIHSEEHFLDEAQWCYDNNFQMVAHAIGDGANELVLNTYAKTLPPNNKRRWRVEHAQIVDESDIEKFGTFNIIPSVQPTHATSDMGWVQERIGNRVKHAYRNKDLLETAGIIVSGSDFPIEDINPIYGFYAAVARRDNSFNPTTGFQMENALSREEALKAMTIWAAYSNFEEVEKGSIEVGKSSDLVILDRDIMQCPLPDIPKAKVLYTILNGEIVFSAT